MRLEISNTKRTQYQKILPHEQQRALMNNPESEITFEMLTATVSYAIPIRAQARARHRICTCTSYTDRLRYTFQRT